MLGGKQHFIAAERRHEGTITSVPGSALDAGAGLDLHAHYLKRYSKRVADRTTMVRPCIGHSLEAMMDVDSTQGRQGLVFCQGRKQVQQDGGIEAAGEGDAPGSGVAPGG
ncbi:hypothetical protein PBDP_1140 [Pseudomonas sp. St290]|nr:hypothetical protein PBDP_1140 [Pseudomonas sp. St290]